MKRSICDAVPSAVYRCCFELLFPDAAYRCCFDMLFTDAVLTCCLGDVVLRCRLEMLFREFFNSKKFSLFEMLKTEILKKSKQKIGIRVIKVIF